MLATQLNHMVHDNQLAPFTIIKVKKHICNQVGGQTKKVVVILEVEIITPGSEVGTKLGNPAQIGSDGKVPDQVPDNQNTNFVLGFNKLSTNQPVQPIISLTPYQNKWTIKARCDTGKLLQAVNSLYLSSGSPARQT